MPSKISSLNGSGGSLFRRDNAITSTTKSFKAATPVPKAPANNKVQTSVTLGTTYHAAKGSTTTSGR